MPVSDSDDSSGKLTRHFFISILHIYTYSTGGKATPRRSTRSKRLTLKAQEALCYRDSVDSKASELLSESDTDLEVLKPSGKNLNNLLIFIEVVFVYTVLHNNEAVTGQKIFSFSNMKRKIGIIEKAAEFQSQISKTPAKVRNKLKKGCTFVCKFI